MGFAEAGGSGVISARRPRNCHRRVTAAIPGTSHRPRLKENVAAATIEISANTEDTLLKVFAPGAANGLRYPETHLRPGISTAALAGPPFINYNPSHSKVGATPSSDHQPREQRPT